MFGSDPTVINWLGHSVTALVTAIIAALSWAIKRQVYRVDIHDTRLTALETTKASHTDLEAAITRMEDTHQRVADQTNQRLDNIYQLLVTLRSQG